MECRDAALAATWYRRQQHARRGPPGKERWRFPICPARPPARVCLLHPWKVCPKAHCATFGPLLAQLQRGESKECKHQRGNPEAHDHLGLAPPQQLEMMVYGRHLEDALAAQLV